MAMLVVLVAVFALTGVFEAFINTPINVQLQSLAPTQYRARVFAVLGIGTQGIVPIGFGIMGIALDIYPAHLIALVVTFATAVIIVAFVWRHCSIVSTGLQTRPVEQDAKP